MSVRPLGEDEDPAGTLRVYIMARIPEWHLVKQECAGGEG